MTEVSIQLTWHDALSRLVTTPAGYRSLINPETASRMLRCDSSELADLVCAGFPTYGQLFDEFDVLNIGLYSGSRKSGPELEFEYFRRLLLSSMNNWTSRISFLLCVEASCLLGDECECTMWLPPSIPGVQWADHTLARGTVRWHGSLTSVGSHSKILNPEIVDVWDSLLQSYRFHYTSDELGLSARITQNRRVGDCNGLSTLLAEKLTKRSIPARVCHGILIGSVQARVHDWVEIVDSDGVRKTLDVTMAILAKDILDIPELVRFCFGARLNRIVEFGKAGVIVGHPCRDTDSNIRPVIFVRKTDNDTRSGREEISKVD